VLIERFDFDDELYADYRVQGPAGQVLPFVGTPYFHNLDWVLSFGTPRFKRFSASGFWLWGRDENFFEWAGADIQILDLSAEVRPTERLRFEGRYQLQHYGRPDGGGTVGERSVPRLKVEYQLSRAVALRVVGEWNGSRQDTLRDDGRTGLPLLVADGTGGFVPALAFARRDLRGDVLFSWQPTPGTVFFAGYGNRLEDPEEDGRGFRRRSDGFFVKLSYLFRL